MTVTCQGVRPLGDAIGQRRALDQFHHECRRAAGLLQSVDLRDVRVIERREHFDFGNAWSQPDQPDDGHLLAHHAGDAAGRGAEDERDPYAATLVGTL